jgi:hypothetical protein
MIISVTSEHIRQGTVNSCVSCPVALAARSAFHAAGISTGRLSVYSCHLNYGRPGTLSGIIFLPPSVRDFIRAFDALEEVIPFEFELEVPDA